MINYYGVTNTYTILQQILMVILICALELIFLRQLSLWLDARNARRAEHFKRLGLM